MPKRQLHREVFFAHNGCGPYTCFGCDEKLAFSDSFDVHHRDADHKNDTLENLVAMHNGCHIKLHKTGRIVSIETRAKISASGKGYIRSLEHRQAIAAAGHNRVWTAEMRNRMSQAQKGRTIDADHRRRIANTLKAQMTPERREHLSVIGRRGAESRWKDGTNG